MSLSDEECTKLYKMVIEDNTNLSWIKERLECGNLTLDQLDTRLGELEIQHSLLKGKLGAFVLGLTFTISLLVNGILWAWSHIGGKS